MTKAENGVGMKHEPIVAIIEGNGQHIVRIFDDWGDVAISDDVYIGREVIELGELTTMKAEGIRVGAEAFEIAGKHGRVVVVRANGLNDDDVTYHAPGAEPDMEKVVRNYFEGYIPHVNRTIKFLQGETEIRELREWLHID